MSEKRELTVEEMNAEMQALLTVGANQIEDLPEFVLPPAGGYLWNVKKFEVAESDDGKMFVDVLLELVECIETTKPEDFEKATALPKGSMASTRYYGAFGIQKLKQEWLQVIHSTVGEEGSISEFMDSVVGMEVAIESYVRKDKNNPEHEGYFAIRKALVM